MARTENYYSTNCILGRLAKGNLCIGSHDQNEMIIFEIQTVQSQCSLLLLFFFAKDIQIEN